MTEPNGEVTPWPEGVPTTVPVRDDYPDLLSWVKDFEAYQKAAEASSQVKLVVAKWMWVIVCAPGDMAAEMVASETNRIHPSGVNDLPWRIANSPLPDGTHNPMDCLDHPGRKHWVLDC